MQDWTQFGGQNPFLDWLEPGMPGGIPQAGYFSYGNQFGRSPNQRDYFKSQFQDVQNQYLGQLGTMIRGGQAPVGRFADFLGEYFTPQSGGAAQQWASLSPRQRGTQKGGFAPPTRWIR